MARPNFATLGPEGSNHDLVLQDYLDRENVIANRLLFKDFDTVLKACEGGTTDRIFICAAHSSCAQVVGTAQYQLDMKISDVFVCESQSLAILHRTEFPKSIALHPATREYANLGAYRDVIEVSSTVEAAEGLRAGQWDAALTAADYADDDLTIALNISPPRDAWLVLGGDEKSPIWKLG